jgi:hypothetical protein
MTSENNLKINLKLFGGFKYYTYICRVNQNTNTMDKQYYRNQLNQVDYHAEYPPTFQIKGETNNRSTKWMNLNEDSAMILVEKLIKEFNLIIT